MIITANNNGKPCDCPADLPTQLCHRYIEGKCFGEPKPIIKPIKRFTEIEGLRAWLAWAVVLAHVAYWSDFKGALGNTIQGLGTQAVSVFIIVSGFVITHLIVQRPEPYSHYIVRRFMRIFPLFAVTCIAGYFSYKLQISLFDRVHYSFEFDSHIRNIVVATDQHLWAQIVSHITMLYGLVSYNILPFADYAFNIQAWSITLEWQFYLIAPLVIAILVKRPAMVPLFALVIVVAEKMFKWGLFGQYDQPTLLFAMGEFFAIGIASRLFFSNLVHEIKSPQVVLALILVIFGIDRSWPLLVWAIVYLGLLVPTATLFYRLALESKIVTYFGTRSYSVYLSHTTAIIICEWLWLLKFPAPPSFSILLMMTIPFTIVISELLYRYVEVPGIKLGSLLCQKKE